MTFRATSRVLIFDERGRTLLFLQYGKSHDVPPRWITPGGGVDPGESHDEAAIREVFEETGLVLESIEPPFLEEDFDPDQRWHPYKTGHWAWYAVYTSQFEPARAGWMPDEVEDIVEWRWLTADELETGEHEYEPAWLPSVVRERARP